MIQGSIVALITPFNSEHKIDFKRLHELIDFQIENKTDGVVLLGTTAEAESLNDEEKYNLVSDAISYIQHRMQVVVGLISNQTEEVVRLATLYKDLSFDAYLVINPYYIKSNTSGLLKHFTYIADRIDKPMILYNVPKRTGMEIPLEVVEALSYHPNIIGIKEASGNVLYLQQVVRLANEHFAVYGGDDFLTLVTYALGAKGMISVIGNAFPKEVKLVYDMYSKNPEISRTTFFKLYDVMKVMYEEVSPIGIKYILYLLGYGDCYYRRPLDEPSLRLKQKLKIEVQKLLQD